MEDMSGESSSRKSYTRLSCEFMLEDEGYGAELFYTYCKVGDRACTTMIGHDSLINAVCIDMVEKL
jgi:DNA primase large subunit